MKYPDLEQVMPTIREATHAGSWYSDDGKQLSQQLDKWLSAVSPDMQSITPNSEDISINPSPYPGARVIIAPHAGYSYSGPAAAWAYKALDLSKAKRVFILGPSHHFYLTNCALSRCDTYETPLGDLRVDKTTIAQLHKQGSFDKMSLSVDEAEHSIEMHLPYVYKMMSSTSPKNAFPPIVPILVGNTSPETEKKYGTLLSPYLADPENSFVISSDFCHWGSRFRYTYYEPDSGPPISLRSSDAAPNSPPIHASIRKVDMACMEAIESGKHDDFLQVLRETGNTVCGRHPIGIIMAGLEELQKTMGNEKSTFTFVQYARSSDCLSPRDSSVSYASAFAVL